MNQLDGRSFRYKNPKSEFYCPLCRTPRAFQYQPRLSKLNWMQIVMITSAVVAILYPWMGMKSFFFFFVIWLSFEFAVRVLFRREIPCPHCGFDASWYKRDVKVARRLVEDFWKQKNLNTQSSDDQNQEGSENYDADSYNPVPPHVSGESARDAYFG